MSKIPIDTTTVGLALYNFEKVKDICDKYAKLDRRIVYGNALIEHFGVVCQALRVKQLAKQEPVAWRWVNPKGWLTYGETQHDTFVSTPLYTSPQPAQRTWVGLTLKDREALRNQFEGWNYPAILVDVISDMLRERNQ